MRPRREELEAIIAKEIREKFAGMRKVNSPRVRKELRNSCEAILRKHCGDLDVPVTHVRGLLDASTNRFYIRVEQSPPPVDRSACSVCEGDAALDILRMAGRSMGCMHCRGSGLEPRPIAKVYDLDRYRSILGQ